eukprot:2607149-Pyramimonas_sp.AAC.1
MTEVFHNFRPLGALTGPRDRQKTTQDENSVLGNGSRLPGTPYGKNTTSDVWGCPDAPSGR